MEIWQKNKFILFTLLAPGFVDFSFTRPNHVFKFQCSLLGLKQALRAWFNCLFSFLLCHGFNLINFVFWEKFEILGLETKWNWGFCLIGLRSIKLTCVIDWLCHYMMLSN